MGSLMKFVGLSLLVIGLAACDDQSSATPANNNMAATQASVPTGESISLLNGDVTFTLPEGLTDQSDKLQSEVNNMYVYANKNGQQAVIVIITSLPSDSLSLLSQRLVEQQKSRDAHLQLLSDQQKEVNGTAVQQVVTIQGDDAQRYYSSIVLAKVGNNLLTMQVSMPADNSQIAEETARGVFDTLKIKIG